MSELYANNIEILKNIYNLELNPDELNYDRFKIEDTKDQKKVLRVLREDNKWVYLGSKYSVQRDLDNFLREIDFTYSESDIIIIGFGLGYHVDEILKRAKKNRVIIFEPSDEILSHALNVFDLRKFRNRNLIIRRVKTYDDAFKELGNYIDKMMLNQVCVKVYANYLELFQKEVEGILGAVKAHYELAILSNTTNVRLFPTIINNYIRNVKNYRYISPINSLRNEFSLKPAVVVSAGPSLSKNIDWLKQYQNDVLIITGPRNVKGLLAIGITPHVVCFLDPSEDMYKFISGIELSNAAFIVCEQTNPEILNEHLENNFLCGIFGEKLHSIFIKYEIDRLPQGGSVSTMCTALAVYMGCTDIIMVGQDLAFEGNRYHDVKTEFKNIDDINKESNLVTLEVEGNYEEKVLTTHPMNGFRKWFEEFIKLYNNLNYVNCTAGGAKINGTVLDEFDKALQKYSKVGFNPFERIKVLYKNNLQIDNKNIQKNFRVFLSNLLNVKKKLEYAVKISSDIAEESCDDEKKSEIMNKLQSIEVIDKKLLKDKAYAVIFKMLFEDIDNEVKRNNEYKEKNCESETDAILRIAKRNVYLYLGYLKKVNNLLELLRKVQGYL